MHHVAVALKNHGFVELLSTELHHTTNIVAGEVDEHDVLGDLLGMFTQFSAETTILFIGPTTPAGSGDRA